MIARELLRLSLPVSIVSSRVSGFGLALVPWGACGPLDWLTEGGTAWLRAASGIATSKTAIAKNAPEAVAVPSSTFLASPAVILSVQRIPGIQHV
jgi:hypothetical protein